MNHVCVVSLYFLFFYMSHEYANMYLPLWVGIPSVEDLISIYCHCRGIPSALPDLNFYLALSVFKMAGIAQV